MDGMEEESTEMKNKRRMEERMECKYRLGAVRELGCDRITEIS
jgi:hypothetical protein